MSFQAIILDKVSYDTGSLFATCGRIKFMSRAAERYLVVTLIPLINAPCRIMNNVVMAALRISTIDKDAAKIWRNV